jgi:4-amino-4-deoxy-L-arabinose transferase-like glycosyltransferase
MATGKAEILDSKVLAIFFLVFAAMCVRLLLSPPIWNHGEAREGLVIQEILRDGEWILPLRNGELPSKPPLFHWISALPALVFGLSDFTVRLPSALGAAIVAVTTFVLGRVVGGPVTGWLSMGSLLAIYEFWDTGTQARVDMIFSACVAISLAGFFLWYRDGRDGARAACYLGAIFAVLAKGPVGVALPAIVIASFLLVEGRLGKLRLLWSWPLIALGLAIDAGWYASAYYIGGREFIVLQIQRENIDRAFGMGAVVADSNFFTMAFWLITRTLPSSVVLLWSLIRRVRGEREDAAGTFFHTWWISIFMLFALAVGKRSVYLLPVYPAIALLAGRAISSMIAGNERGVGAESSGCIFARRFLSTKVIGVSIVVMDLILMLVTRSFSKRLIVEKARLAFINEVGAIVPAQASLFATPAFDNSELFVIAYRLRRDINRKSLVCGERNEYFLAPFDLGQTSVETRVLASSKMHDASLVTLPSAPTVPRDEECLRTSSYAGPVGKP